MAAAAAAGGHDASASSMGASARPSAEPGSAGGMSRGSSTDTDGSQIAMASHAGEALMNSAGPETDMMAMVSRKRKSSDAIDSPGHLTGGDAKRLRAMSCLVSDSKDGTGAGESKASAHRDEESHDEHPAEGSPPSHEMLMDSYFRDRQGEICTSAQHSVMANKAILTKAGILAIEGAP